MFAVLYDKEVPNAELVNWTWSTFIRGAYGRKQLIKVSKIEAFLAFYGALVAIYDTFVIYYAEPVTYYG